RREQLLFDGLFDALKLRTQIEGEPGQVDLLDARAPHRLSVRGVANQNGEDAEPPANLLDVEAAGLQQLGVFRGQTEWLEREAGRQGHDLPGPLRSAELVEQLDQVFALV